MKVLTLYAFSAENWTRPTTEVQALNCGFFKTMSCANCPSFKKNTYACARSDGSRRFLPARAEAFLLKPSKPRRS